MGLFKKSLPDILKGFHKTISDLDALEASHQGAINFHLGRASDLRDQINDHHTEIGALEIERVQALAVKEKIAILIGA